MHDVTIVFDLDGTLVDTAPDLIAATNHVLASRGLGGVTSEILRPAVSHGARRMIEVALDRHGQRVDEPTLGQLLAQFLEHYAANIAVESVPFPGLEPALDTLAQRGARLAVCTNKREGLSRQLLAALSLSDRFAAIAGRDTFAVFKPHPEHLTGAIRLAGGDPRRAIMIGDSATDIATARAAAIPVVGVTFGYTDTPVTELGADAVVEHYDQLVGAIERIGFT